MSTLTRWVNRTASVTGVSSVIKIGRPDMFFGSVLSLFLVQRCAHATFPTRGRERERGVGMKKKGKLKIRVVYHDTISGFNEESLPRLWASNPRVGNCSISPFLWQILCRSFVGQTWESFMLGGNGQMFQKKEQIKFAVFTLWKQSSEQNWPELTHITQLFLAAFSDAWDLPVPSVRQSHDGRKEALVSFAIHQSRPQSHCIQVIWKHKEAQSGINDEFLFIVLYYGIDIVFLPPTIHSSLPWRIFKWEDNEWCYKNRSSWNKRK